MQKISAKHSFNAGDLIASLAGFNHLYKTKEIQTTIYQQLNYPAYYYDDAVIATKDMKGNSVCMNEYMFNMLKPLIESLPYIEKFVVWEGQEVDINLDATRDRKYIPMPNGLIHHWTFAIAPELQCDLSEKWIPINCRNENNIILINRTERYYNTHANYHYFFLKKYEDYIVFTGTKREHEIFCNKFKLNVPLLEVKDFLSLAKAIASCRFFIGNQSLCFHLADAMKKERILEICNEFPNTFPTGKNGYAAYYQEHLEIYTKRLFNK